MMLGATDLSLMRSTLTASLPDTCTIQRVTRTVGVMGQPSDTWATLSTPACRVSPASRPDEVAVLNRIEAKGGWTVTLPATQDVTAKDRIVSGARTLEVVGILAPRSWEIGRRVVCIEVV